MPAQPRSATVSATVVHPPLGGNHCSTVAKERFEVFYDKMYKNSL
jgi:hypothetical protein